MRDSYQKLEALTFAIAEKMYGGVPKAKAERQPLRAALVVSRACRRPGRERNRAAARYAMKEVPTSSARAHQLADEVRAVVHVELLVEAPDVRANGVLAQACDGRHVDAAVTSDEQASDLSFTSGKALHRGGGLAVDGLHSHDRAAGAAKDRVPINLRDRDDDAVRETGGRRKRLSSGPRLQRRLCRVRQRVLDGSTSAAQ